MCHAANCFTSHEAADCCSHLSHCKYVPVPNPAADCHLALVADVTIVRWSVVKAAAYAYGAQ